jgi:hypothetical protein
MMMSSEKQNDTSKFNLMNIPTQKKNTFLKAAKANAATKAFKRVFFHHPKIHPSFFYKHGFFAQSEGHPL